jgi:hypothetical protein
MATIKARTIAFAAAVAVGVLCETLICQPAQAQSVAFGNTSSATLTLYDGSTMVAILHTGGFQGWIANSDSLVPPNLGGTGISCSSCNTSYVAGSLNGALLADYFVFNTAAVSPTLTVTSATLTVNPGEITANLKYTLFAATQWITDFQTLADQNAALFTAMVNSVGTGSYGAFNLTKNTTTSGTLADLVFTLNAAAVSDIEAQIKAGKEFAIGGATSAPVPEPSTWIMMLAGFAGLGVIARRRAAKRRAAAAPG